MIFKCDKCGKPRELTRKPKTNLCRNCSYKPIKHGDSKKDSQFNGLYTTWMSTINRCRFKDTYKDIKRCPEWDDYLVFKKWALTNGYQKELTIDRKNNDGDYEPSNCRWVTQQVQSDNQRLITKANTSGYRGVSKRNGKYVVNLKVNKKTKQMGTYVNIKHAAQAYNDALDDFGYTDRPRNII